jgi:SAM-dependent methyltransferase
MQDASARWAADLAAWGIPEQILSAAPQSPWIHPVDLFRAEVEPADSPSHSLARAALPYAGSVLDVGCGGGRAALAVAPPARLVIGVDHQPEMLRAFADAAAARDLQHAEVLGSWPEVAGDAPIADVVVCHHVAYNVADLAGFALALDARAGRRVVIELTDRHPLARMAPLWQRFWGLERPEGPTAEQAAAVLREAGLPVRDATWESGEDREARLAFEDRVRFTRVRLCLPPERDPEVAEALRDIPAAPRRLVALWWEAPAVGPPVDSAVR